MGYQEQSAHAALLAEFQQETKELALEKRDSGAGIPYFKFDSGDEPKTYYFRPLPSKIPGKHTPICKSKLHWKFLDPNTNKDGKFPCLSLWGEECPFCKYLEVTKQKIAALGGASEAEMERIKKMEANEGYLMYVVNMEDGKIGYLQFHAKKAFDAFNNKFTELIAETGAIGTDPTNGVVFKITKSGSYSTLNYQIITSARGHALNAEQMMTYNALPDLMTAGVGRYTQAECQKVLNGVPITNRQYPTPKLTAPQGSNNLIADNSTVAAQQSAQTQQPAYQQPMPQAQVVETVVAQPVAAQPAQQAAPVQTQPVQPTMPQGPQSFPNPNAAGQPQPSVEDIHRMIGGGN